MANIIDFPSEEENLQIICDCGNDGFDLLFIPEHGYFLCCQDCNGVVPTSPFELVDPEELH